MQKTDLVLGSQHCIEMPALQVALTMRSEPGPGRRAHPLS